MQYANRGLVTAAILLTIGFAVGACEIQRAQQASDAQKSMVGMPKEQVLSCMGAPANRAVVGGTEVWTYNSGDDRTDTVGVANAWGGWGHAFAVGSSTSTSRSCKIDVVMNNDRVRRVNYTGPTGGLLTEGEQCAYAVSNCAQMTSSDYATPVATPQSIQLTRQTDRLEDGTPAAGLGNEGTPRLAACTKEEEALVKLAKENGYQYHSNCVPRH